jgi:hypothetical protein
MTYDPAPWEHNIPQHNTAPYLGSKDPAEFIEDQAQMVMAIGTVDAVHIGNCLMSVAEYIRDMQDMVSDAVLADLDAAHERIKELEEGLEKVRDVVRKHDSEEITKLKRWLMFVEEG